jgi:hypothetical protein
MIRSAHSVFCPPAFTDAEVEKIFAAAARVIDRGLLIGRGV